MVRECSDGLNKGSTKGDRHFYLQTELRITELCTASAGQRAKETIPRTFQVRLATLNVALEVDGW